MVRITRFHAVDFRSLADVRLEDLPEVVLLYGENDLGKSNILRAVGAWLKLVAHVLRGRSDQLELDHDGTRRFVLDQKTADRLLGRPVALQFRQEQLQMQLEGTLSLLQRGETSPIDFGFSLEATLVEPPAQRNDSGAEGTEPAVVSLVLQQVNWPERGLLRDSIPASDRALTALRAALADPWLWISSERRFYSELWRPELEQESRSPAELAPASDNGGDQMPAPNGLGLLRWLVRAYIGTDRALRQAFEKRFVRMLASGPFSLGAPRPVVDEQNWCDLWVGDRSIREHGSGPRQWALIAGMMSSRPSCRSSTRRVCVRGRCGSIQGAPLPFPTRSYGTSAQRLGAFCSRCWGPRARFDFSEKIASTKSSKQRATPNVIGTILVTGDKEQRERVITDNYLPGTINREELLRSIDENPP